MIASSLICVSVLFTGLLAEILPNDYWGTAYVTKQGIGVQFEINGYANYRWNAPHTSNSRFPVGSNTKLFTAVAVYQLYEEGLLNVSDSVTDYLDESDFKSMGLNITKWCPMIYNDPTKTCQNITFIQLLSMSSGLLPNYACQEMYNETNPLYKYCWDFCTFSTEAYQGSLGYYVKSIITSPMTFKPGTQYQYCNMNFILVSYIIEKLSGLSFDLYLNTKVMGVMGLNNTYCDLWDGQFGDNPYRVDEYFLIQNEDNLLDNLGIGWCAPYASMGMSSGSGCVISNNIDMNMWYTNLFNNSNGYIPKVFKYKETRDMLLYPYTLTNELNNGSIKEYYAQGIIVQYNVSDYSYPSLIYYNGATFCSHTAMKMIPNNTGLVISAFNNAPHMIIPNGEQGLYNLRYNTAYSICQMAYEQKLVKGDNGLSYWVANELLKIYT